MLKIIYSFILISLAAVNLAYSCDNDHQDGKETPSNEDVPTAPKKR